MRLRTIVMLLALAGCAYSSDPSLHEANIVRPGNFKAGSGVIQSVGVVPRARPAGTGADSKGSHPDRNLYRLYLIMDGFGFQSVDIDSSRFLAGEAVELTNDGRVVRVSGTSLNQAIGGR
jgi:hypothetical protein